METLLYDLRYGARRLLKTPGFTAVALITLALGIGASTAIFSLIDAVLLRPLPFPKPEQVVSFEGVNLSQGITESNISAPDFVDWQKRSDAFSQMGLFVSSNAILSSETNEPVRVPRAIAASGFFSSLGLRPLMGRFFTAADDKEGAEPVAVLGNALWQRRFGADLDIIGRKIIVNGRTLTVVGVMPRGFAYPSETEIWTSLAFNPLEERRENRSFEAVARLKPNVTLAQAQAQLTAINGQLSRQFHETNDRWDVTLVRLQDRLVRDVRPALLALLGAVLFVLVIACANVANLLLARASSRQREIAICAALGASRRRVVRQLVTESLLLSILGGAFGFVLSAWLIELLVRVSPLQAPRLDEIGVDYRVFAFTLFLSLGSGIFFGLVPALQATKRDLNESLNEGGRAGGAGHRGGRTRNLLLVGEVALSLMLLVGAGLLIKSFRHLREVHPGFNPANLLTLSITLPYARYPENAQHAAFFENIIAQTRALPGVQSTAAVLSLPLGGSDYSVGRSFIVEGRPLTTAESTNASYIAATPDYFRTMQIPLLAGRDVTTQDRTNSPKVVVVNQSLAQRVFGSPEKAIGKRLTVWRDEDFMREIVGVVGDSKGSALDEPNQPQLFVPYAQDASWNTLSLVVRCASDPHAMAGAVRAKVLALDKGLPIYRVQTMDDVLRKSTATNRVCMLLFSVFAAAALLLAAIGIYGVMAYVVTQRTHEIGIRMALGAQSGDVLRLVVRQGMTLAMGGIGVGLAGALALSRGISGLLYGVKTADPATYLEILILLVSVAFFACYMPARRAAKLNPVTALAQR